MKTPWSDLLKYGIGTATFIVMAICGIIMLAAIGLVILITKVLVFIK
jgi:hypothetical protein